MRTKPSGRGKASSSPARKGRRPPRTHAPRNRFPRPAELPKTYGTTLVVLTCINPHLMHVSWEVSRADLRRALRTLRVREQEAAAVLRFYDLTSTDNVDSVPLCAFDVSTDLSTGNCYVPLWSADKEYYVEIGLTTPGGDFVTLARSNSVVVPPSEPSDAAPLTYAFVAPHHADSSGDALLLPAIYPVPEIVLPPPAEIVLSDLPADIAPGFSRPPERGAPPSSASERAIRGPLDDLTTDADSSFSAGLPSSSL